MNCTNFFFCGFLIVFKILSCQLNIFFISRFFLSGSISNCIFEKEFIFFLKFNRLCPKICIKSFHKFFIAGIFQRNRISKSFYGSRSFSKLLFKAFCRCIKFILHFSWHGFQCFFIRFTPQIRFFFKGLESSIFKLLCF